MSASDVYWESSAWLGLISGLLCSGGLVHMGTIHVNSLKELISFHGMKEPISGKRGSSQAPLQEMDIVVQQKGSIGHYFYMQVPPHNSVLVGLSNLELFIHFLSSFISLSLLFLSASVLKEKCCL